MSGIAGVISLDGAPVDSGTIQRMLAAISHRGNDSVGVWNEGNAGLGHCLLQTLPEDSGVRFPLAHAGGDLIITADVRLDNRETLITLMDLQDRDTTHLSDSWLILEAYQKWGERCPEWFLGDFAFAIWDKCRKQLFCARDHFGIKPLYYYHHGNVLAFASEIKALLALPFVSPEPNENRIAEYLLGFATSKTETGYHSVFRLPPGHILKILDQRIRVQPYWEIDLDPSELSMSDDDFAAQFQELFTEAVKSRLRSSRPVGSMLSGGLDSSAIVGVARRIFQETDRVLPTFTATFPHTPETDESKYARLVADLSGIEPYFVPVDQLSPMYYFDDRSSHVLEELNRSSNTYTVWRLLEVAKEKQIVVMLDGHDGDTTVSHGENYFAELANANRWRDFAYEADLMTQHSEVPGANFRLTLFMDFAVPILRKRANNHQWLSLLKAAYPITSTFSGSLRRYMRYYVLPALAPAFVHRTWRRARRKSAYPDILSPEFAARISHIIDVKDQLDLSLLSEHEKHPRSLTSEWIVEGNEFIDLLTSSFGMEARHPFYDKRLVEFAIRLPIHQKRRDGWTRFILRKALEDVLPPQVQWRPGKSNLGHAFRHSLRAQEMPRFQKLLDSDSPIWTYLSKEKIMSIQAQYIAAQRERNSLTLWKVAELARWLELFP